MNFSEQDKIIIKQLVDYDFSDKLTTLGRFFSDEIIPNEFRIYCDYRQQYALIFCKEENKKRVLYSLGETFSLIQTLIEKRLIFILPSSPTSSCFAISKIPLKDSSLNKIFFDDDSFIDVTKLESGIKDKKGNPFLSGFFTIPNEVLNIPYFAGSLPVISEELRKIVKNNFVSNEDAQLEQAKKQTQWASWTFIGSIVAVVLSLITLLCSLNK